MLGLNPSRNPAITAASPKSHIVSPLPSVDVKTYVRKYLRGDLVDELTVAVLLQVVWRNGDVDDDAKTSRVVPDVGAPPYYAISCRFFNIKGDLLTSSGNRRDGYPVIMLVVDNRIIFTAV